MDSNYSFRQEFGDPEGSRHRIGGAAARLRHTGRQDHLSGSCRHGDAGGQLERQWRRLQSLVIEELPLRSHRCPTAATTSASAMRSFYSWAERSG